MEKVNLRIHHNIALSSLQRNSRLILRYQVVINQPLQVSFQRHLVVLYVDTTTSIFVCQVCSLFTAGLHTELLYGKAGRLIGALDQISGTLGKEINLSFPQIIVCGDEQSGKSTLLERIAMLQFFPRDKRTNIGEGFICTRMPIRLQLKHLSIPDFEDWCNKNSLPSGQDKVKLQGWT